MKFRYKIFVTFLLIYMLIFFTLSILITQRSYDSMRDNEIERSLSDFNGINYMVALYLRNMESQNRVTDYALSIIDIFGEENCYLEVYDDEGNLLAGNSPVVYGGERKEFEQALESRGGYAFVVRHDENGVYYVSACAVHESEGKQILLNMHRDISMVDVYRGELYRTFMQIGGLGLVLSAIVIWIVTAFLLRPIKELDQVTQEVAKGDYSKRAICNSNDELGSLANKFNFMAEEIENKINELELEGMRQQRFLDNMTHEMRTPLTSIIGYAELLQKVDYNENREIYEKGLGYINTEGKRILNLNKMLLDLTYYRNSEIEKREESMLLVVKEVCEFIRTRAEEKSITLQISGTDFVLPMDRDMIKSLILNLVDNSIKACDVNGMIVVSLEDDVKAYHLLIKDNGRGMSEEDLERIREPFYRVDKSRSRQDGGAGLGIALCEHIAHRHNGELLYRSRLGVGTVVEVVFFKE